jgi:hypothetical protein
MDNRDNGVGRPRFPEKQWKKMKVIAGSMPLLSLPDAAVSSGRRKDKKRLSSASNFGIREH